MTYSWVPLGFDMFSDHFHPDHKDYYEPFMNKYRVGMSRDRTIGDLDRFAVQRILAR